jgi:hypothetical protein
MDIAALRQAIPALLTELGEDAKAAELGPDAWVVHRGSTMGYVAILGGDDPGMDPFLHVKFQILQAPAEGGELVFRRLLRLNHDLGSFAAFSLDEHNIVSLGAGRFVADLDEGELREVVTQTARLADRFDDELVDFFGEADSSDDN